MTPARLIEQTRHHVDQDQPGDIEAGMTLQQIKGDHRPHGPADQAEFFQLQFGNQPGDTVGQAGERSTVWKRIRCTVSAQVRRQQSILAGQATHLRIEQIATDTPAVNQ